MKIKKVLLLGSGALKIGQAGEFDYSGSQALKALKEEKIETILINPNIATVQTTEGMADKIYFVPVNSFFVEKIIEKEKPEGILLAFGGQTALNCGVELFKKGILKKHNVKVLGTPVKAIMETEDRELFNKKLAEINVSVPKSIACNNKKEALNALKKIGFPVIVRAAYALGGQGSGKANSEKQFNEIIDKVFAHSPQVLVEEYLGGWKEIEYEVMRDSQDNCITVCNMENFDPMGIHTGESIVIAPSQTLTNEEYHSLREASIKIIRHLGIVGECNVQYALDPKSHDFKVIEVNARLSRSSALASKATGYPLAFIATKLALGKSLIDLPNSVTKKTTACFEPALDYCVLKIPRWDLQKFKKVSKSLGSEMKSVGEVMSIGRTFEEALQKALRMLDIGVPGLTWHRIKSLNSLEKELKQPTDKRIFAIEKAMRKGMDFEKIHKLSGINQWFLHKMKKIVDFEKVLLKTSIKKISKEQMLKAKQLGFSDEQISLNLKCSEKKVRKKRKKFKVIPVVKQIDTLAAEYPAQTNYLYLTYSENNDDISFNKKNHVIVLGSGPYRIGSSVEFDWCGVNAIKTLQKLGFYASMINFNPETVSTDYDECDRLYFEELSFERVLDIYEKENPFGLILSTGGQIPNNIAMKCREYGINVLGTSPESIDNAENRNKFSALCDSLGIDQPEWAELKATKDALKFAEKAGYPVLVRPSYVLSGAAMNVAFNEKELKQFLNEAVEISRDYPVIISKFIIGAKEIEIDAVANNGDLVLWAISEHVENAGVHSGDATLVLPAQRTYIETMRRVKQIATQLAKALNITGPFNVQMIAKRNEVKVIECNLRSSRSFPFVSKVFGQNFIEYAIKAITNHKFKKPEKSSLELDYVGVKAPQFSFSRLKGADPILSVEMASTGEVACLGKDLDDALLKSLISAGFKLPQKNGNVLISISGDETRYDFLDEIILLQKMGFKLFATESTHEFLTEQGIKSKLIFKAHEEKQPNVSNYLSDGRLELAIVLSDHLSKKELKDEYLIRRKAVDFGVPLITNLQLAQTIVSALNNRSLEDLEIMPWDHYLKNKG